MKKVVGVVAVILVALVGYNYLNTGKLTLIPASAQSDEDRELDQLRKLLEGAKTRFAQAGRAAGLSGVDTTADAESARIEIEKVQKRVKEMKRKASEAVKQKIQMLEDEIEAVKRDIGVK